MDLLPVWNRSKLRLTACFFAFVAAAASLLADPSQAGNGPPTRSLRHDAGVTLTLITDPTGTKYFASLRNEGAKPLFLVLGSIMANDKWLCPDSIALLITGPDGRAHHSKSRSGCNPGGVIGGRMDPWIVPLAAGASYSLPVLHLHGAPTGRYIVKARYSGVPISLRSCNADMQGLSLIHYWTGSVESSAITVNIR